MRYVCVFICFLLWLIFTLLLSFTVIGLVISVSDEWQEMGDKNMIKYNKELKESRSTKKHCEGLRKHIANLERRLLRHTLANVILSIISVATIIALFTLIQN